MNSFVKMAKGKLRGDFIFSISGQVDTCIKFNKRENIQVLLSLMTQAVKFVQDDAAQSNREFFYMHELLASATLSRLLQFMGSQQQATVWANRVIELSKEPYFPFCCIGVTCNAMENVAGVFAEQQNFAGVQAVVDALNLFKPKYTLQNLVIGGINKKVEAIQQQYALQQQKVSPVLPTNGSPTNNPVHQFAATTPVMFPLVQQQQQHSPTASYNTPQQASPILIQTPIMQPQLKLNDEAVHSLLQQQFGYKTPASTLYSSHVPTPVSNSTNLYML